MIKRDSITPGKPWLDEDGNRIQAHAGYMLYEDDTFYWYGENKERTDKNGKVWHWGVRLYSSKDLYNWKSEGIILEPEEQDKNSPIHYSSQLDRPHIIYNEESKTYVMWLKIMTDKSAGFIAFATSSSIKGPFKIVKTDYYPNGFPFGDYDLIKDGKTAYCVYEAPHTKLVISPLRDDYLGVKDDEYKTYFHNGFPPFIREAPALFERKGKKYMITSGTTGYFPNPSEVAVSDSYMGNWQILGDPHVDDKRKTSFDSQISCVFKHPKKKDLYIAMADRWLIDLPENLPDIGAIFESHYNPAKSPIPLDVFSMTKYEIAKADYVWLPIEFDGDVPKIKWRDSWKIEDFD